MKKIISVLILALLTIGLKAQPSHEKWNSLLSKYVTPSGNVNYEGLKSEHSMLEAYLQILSNNSPQDSWKKEEKMAFWINAYNAFTVELILKNYPVKSINDIQQAGKKPWDIPFIKIGNKNYTLNNIEHDILRKKYADPRIHFAVNCASVSCPPLLNEAFTAEKLNTQMSKLASRFINDPVRNKISSGSVQISQIFNWFKDDFTKNGSLIDFLNKYSKTKISASAKISFLDYNWNLNN